MKLDDSSFQITHCQGLLVVSCDSHMMFIVLYCCCYSVTKEISIFNAWVHNKSFCVKFSTINTRGGRERASAQNVKIMIDIYSPSVCAVNKVMLCYMVTCRVELLS